MSRRTLAGALQARELQQALLAPPRVVQTDLRSIALLVPQVLGSMRSWASVHGLQHGQSLSTPHASMPSVLPGSPRAQRGGRLGQLLRTSMPRSRLGCL